MKKLFGGLVLAALGACGGGGGDPSTIAITNTAGTTGYTAATPRAGTTATYAVTQVDNLGNTFNRSFVRTITSVFPDGTVATHWSDPLGSTLVSGTVNHTAFPTEYQLNSAGQDLSYTVTLPSGSVTCTDMPHGDGPPAHLAMGEQWTNAYSITCGTNAPVAFTQTGQLIGVETVTVPAGTFTAYRLDSTRTWTSGALTTTETVQRWVNTDPTQQTTLKISSNIAYSGATPASGALVSDSRTLLSITN